MDQINTTIIEFIKSRGVDDYSKFRNFYMFNETINDEILTFKIYIDSEMVRISACVTYKIFNEEQMLLLRREINRINTDLLLTNIFVDEEKQEAYIQSFIPAPNYALSEAEFACHYNEVISGINEVQDLFNSTLPLVIFRAMLVNDNYKHSKLYRKFLNDAQREMALERMKNILSSKNISYTTNKDPFCLEFRLDGRSRGIVVIMRIIGDNYIEVTYLLDAKFPLSLSQDQALLQFINEYNSGLSMATLFLDEERGYLAVRSSFTISEVDERMDNIIIDIFLRNFYITNRASEEILAYVSESTAIADIEPLDEEQMEWILNYFELYFEE